MTETARLYYKAHITIEPVFDERLAQARKIAKRYGFKVADLLMRKREKDSEERSANDTFCTGHGKEFSDLQGRLVALVLELQVEGFRVWRYKIEDTMEDSRVNDVWELLTERDPRVTPRKPAQKITLKQAGGVMIGPALGIFAATSLIALLGFHPEPRLGALTLGVSLALLVVYITFMLPGRRNA